MTSACCSCDIDELSAAAATPACFSASTWSRIRAISGEITTPDAMPAHRGNLVAHRFARAGREQHDGVAAAGDVAHHGFLLAAEGRVAEDVMEDRGGIAALGGGEEVHESGLTTGGVGVEPGARVLVL